MIFGVDLIQSFFVDKEISVNWNCSYNWSVVENLGFDIFSLGRNTVVSDINLFAISKLFGTGFGSVFSGGIVGSAGSINQSIEFSIVKGTGDESSFALGVDEFIAEDGGLGRDVEGILSFGLFAESI